MRSLCPAPGEQPPPAATRGSLSTAVKTQRAKDKQVSRRKFLKMRLVRCTTIVVGGLPQVMILTPGVSHGAPVGQAAPQHLQKEGLFLTLQLPL